MKKAAVGALLALALAACSGPRKQLEELKHELIGGLTHAVLKELKAGSPAGRSLTADRGSLT